MGNDLKLHLESIDMPEMPELTRHGPSMFFNGNKAFLGVVTDNTKSRDGVLVNEVVENSVLLQGLQRGDIITMINDKTVESTNNPIEILSTYQPGEVINVTYLRDDSKQQATATLKEKRRIFLNLQNGNSTVSDGKNEAKLLKENGKSGWMISRCDGKAIWLMCRTFSGVYLKTNMIRSRDHRC